MADPDVVLKGIFGVDDASPPTENTGSYLDHVAVEVDMSEVEGRFEVREDESPDSPVRWVLEAHRACGDARGGGGGMSSVPPPNR